MLQFIRRHSLSKDYLHFAGVVFAIMLAMIMWIGISAYNSQINQRSHLIESEAQKVEQSLADSFDYIFYLMGFLSNQISLNGADLPYINSLYTGFKNDFKVKDLSSWSMFDWLVPERKIVLTSTHGILKEPVDMTMRPNLISALREPGKIFINDPDLGRISKQWIIPASVAVTDTHSKTILGLINIGVAVTALTSKIEHNLTNNHLRFALLTRSLDFVTESTANTPKLEKGFLKEHLQNIDFSKGKQSSEGVQVHFGDVTYSYFIASEKFPYVIAIGFDDSLSSTSIIKKLAVQLSPILVMGLFSMIILFQFGKSIITPIVGLSDAAFAISKGNLQTIVPKGRSLEANNLACALENVKTLIQKEQDFNATLEQCVTERTESLQDALNARHDFLNHLSHEIRTPVSSIHARSDILLELWDEFNHVELKESIQDIQRNSLHVCQLVTSLLDLSKTRAGKMVYDMQEHDVVLIAAQIVEECRPLYSQKSLQLVMENTAIHRVALCDAMRIGQVIRNLLSNACRYTPSGQVQLVVSNADMQAEDGRVVPSICLSVRDEGVGIPEGEQHKIFESFTQSSRTNTKAGGTGIGLAISLEITNAHHGQIWADNNTDGKGSLFVFLIPRLPVV